mmetsp:Transcript_12908/g.35040  ORF Transcript_12908/g.35040 Transcript_12908/m.35040 type:complete len:241 (-) Transcript_12908:1454-2176(-)
MKRAIAGLRRWHECQREMSPATCISQSATDTEPRERSRASGNRSHALLRKGIGCKSGGADMSVFRNRLMRLQECRKTTARPRFRCHALRDDGGFGAPNARQPSIQSGRRSGLKARAYTAWRPCPRILQGRVCKARRGSSGHPSSRHRHRHRLLRHGTWGGADMSWHARPRPTRCLHWNCSAMSREAAGIRSRCPGHAGGLRRCERNSGRCRDVSGSTGRRAISTSRRCYCMWRWRHKACK